MAITAGWFREKKLMHTLKTGVAQALSTQPMHIETFSLNQVGKAWFVDQGNIDIFAVKLIDGQFVGARHHVCRANNSDCLLGCDPFPDDMGYGLLAVATPGTQFYQLDLQTLTAVTRLRVLESWVSLLTRNAPMRAQPKLYLTVDQANSMPLKKGAMLSTDGAVAWVMCTKGALAFLGRTNQVISADSSVFPLRHDTWLEALDEAVVESCDVEKLLHDTNIWEVASAYTTLILRNFLETKEEVERSEIARLKLKTVNSSAVMENALAGFNEILGSKSVPLVASADDALLAACKLIGEKLSITFVAASASSRIRNDPVENIAMASSVRVRTVALKGDWWAKDNGPMLAFYGEEKLPVALLPVQDKTYQWCDPHTGVSLPLSADIAGQLAPFAHIFYRTFAPVSLNAIDLIKFGRVGLKRDVLLVLMIGVALGLVGMIVPILTGKLFDSVIPSADRAELWQMAVILIAVAVASSAFQYARSVAMLRIEGKMDSGIQAAIWDRVLNLPVPFFREYSAGDLAVRVNGINTIRQALSGAAVTSILAGISSCFSFALLFYYSVTLALIASGLVLVAIVVTMVFGYMMLRYDRQLSAVQGKISGMVLQYLGGIAKLKVSGAETRAFANWAKDFAFQETLSYKSGAIGNVAATFFAILPVMFSMIIFAAIAYLMKKAQGPVLTTGEFIAFTAAFGSFLAAAVGLSNTLLSLVNIVPIYERAKPILQTLPEIDQSSVDPGELSGKIEVASVSFRYSQDGPAILDEICFSILPGEFVAIVGPSGSGKSTLIRMLLGFEKPSSGAIYYDGQDLADLAPRAVRRQFGVVLQNGQLMTGDIFTNIVGASMLTLDDAWEAARLCGLDEDIKAMPMGMYTVVSEGGSTLSGGQRQRIMIARAIAHRPRILIFDEATSALDNRTQAIVSKSLEQLKATRIVIAHRLSTIVNADRILVIENGKVIQQGKYDELIRVEGQFKELAKRQIA